MQFTLGRFEGKPRIMGGSMEGEILRYGSVFVRCGVNGMGKEEVVCLCDINE